MSGAVRVTRELERLHDKCRELERDVRGLQNGARGGGGWAGPSKGTGLAVGDTIFKFTTADVTVNGHRWLCCNTQSAGARRTVGDASSAATAWASADAGTIFAYLWTNIADAWCAVSGGRGASAAADFAAHKTIQLPDWRDRYPVGRGYIRTASGAHDNLADDARSPSSHDHAHAITTGNESTHTHGLSGNTGSGGGHSHALSGDMDLPTPGDFCGAGDWGLVNDVAGGNYKTHIHGLTYVTTDTAATHTHGVSGNTGAGAAHNHTVGGTITAASPWPPYLAVCMYILAEIA